MGKEPKNPRIDVYWTQVPHDPAPPLGKFDWPEGLSAEQFLAQAVRSATREVSSYAVSLDSIVIEGLDVMSVRVWRAGEPWEDAASTSRTTLCSEGMEIEDGEEEGEPFFLAAIPFRHGDKWRYRLVGATSSTLEAWRKCLSR